MTDTHERRAFLAMLDADVERGGVALPAAFGSESWRRFLNERRFAARRLPVTCRCGYRCPGPFMEMHDCTLEGRE